MGRTRRDSPRKGDLREQAILDTAEALLKRETPETITVEAIANGAGISRGSLYFYFGSKQEVLTALVARTVAVLTADAAAASLDAGTPPEDVVGHAVMLTARMWREHGRVMRLASDLSPAVPEIGALWDAAMDDYIAAMSSVLERAGLSEGPGPADAPALARTLCWMTERALYRASRAADPGELDTAAQSCTAIWHRTIAVR